MNISSSVPDISPNPQPRPFSRGEKGGQYFLSPLGREVRSEGTEGSGVRAMARPYTLRRHCHS